MNLMCQGVVVLSAGEWVELTRRLAHNVTSSTLTEMTLGGDVSPVEAHRTLDIDVGLAAGGDERVHVLLDHAMDRLELAFPDQISRTPSLAAAHA